MQPNLDLSMESLIKACKGNVKALPSFMVHDNAAWPWPDSVKLDGKNRIHMRRSTFLRTVSEDLPVRAGIWHGIDVQEFHLELEAHHLGGGADQQKYVGHKQSRALVMADKYGRPLGDLDHGDAALESNGVTQSELDDSRNEIDGPARGVASTFLSASNDG